MAAPDSVMTSRFNFNCWDFRLDNCPSMVSAQPGSVPSGAIKGNTFSM